jgi:DNA-binding beta-propeller fold protein YncE
MHHVPARACERISSLALSLCLLWLAGCSGVDKSKAPAPENVSIVWPAPPESPRIAYSKLVSRPADLGIKRSGLTRFGQWLTGSEKGNEPFIKPFGIAFDEKDNLCLTDTGANVVCFYDQEKRKWHRWEKVGKVRFSSPVAVARRNGIFYVADSGLASIIAFDDAGKLRFNITNQLQRPVGIAVGTNEVLVADSQRHMVVVFDLFGKFLREFGKRGTAPGEFNFPTHLCVDIAGHIVVTDSMNARVQVFDAAGHFQGQLGTLGDSSGQFSRPKGVATDTLAHVYVIDAMFDNVQIFDKKDVFLLNFGQAGTQPGEFWLPNGIAINQANEIFVTDSYNRRIQVFKYIGPS